MIDEKKLIREMREKIPPERFGERCNPLDVIYGVLQLIDEQPKVGEWIPFTVDDEGILDCEIPDEGQEILVSDGVNVVTDIFMNDGEECYLDGWSRDLAGLAWKPLPEPYKED